MPSFSFQYAHHVSQEEWTSLHGVQSLAFRRWSRRGRLRMLGFVLLSLALLLSPYTFSVGVVFLGVAAVVLTLPRLTGSAARDQYARQRHLHLPAEHGADAEGFWFHGDQLSARCLWPNLYSWQEQNGMLCLYGCGMPPVYLPVSALREAGAYTVVRALAEEHAGAVGGSRPRLPAPRAMERPRA
jgi:hypothetical protein